MNRIVLAGGVAIQHDGLVGNDAGLPIGRRGVDAVGIQVRLGAGDEEGASLMQYIKACEVDVAAIHDVDGARFGEQQIEGVNVVQLAVRDVNEARNVAAQIEQRVHLHGRLGGAKVRPWKQRQAQIDGGGVQSIDRVAQLQAQTFVGIKLPRLGNQPVGELRVNAPVARLVGIGQRRSPDRLAKAHVVELRGLSRQADLDIAQALSVGQLRERHRSVLLGTAQRSHPSVATVARNNPRKLAPRQKIHELGEKRFADVHGRLEKLRIAPDQVQIDTTHFRPLAPPKSALSRTRLAVNRTAVIKNYESADACNARIKKAPPKAGLGQIVLPTLVTYGGKTQRREP